MVGDSAIAVLLAVMDLTLTYSKPDRPPAFVLIPLIAAMVLPLVIRRRHPVSFAYLVLVIGTPHAALELGVAALVIGCIAVYTLLVYVGRKHAAGYLAAQVVTSVVQIVIQLERDRWLIAIGFTLGTLAFSWILGEFVGARRAYHAELEARLHLLETERDQATKIAVAEERSRIARELHDIVAHSVSVMVVQADGARYAIDSDPALAQEAVRTISETGREALTELRRLLGVLRNSDSDAEPREPQPGVGSLDELVDRMGAAGLRVQLHVDDDVRALPAGVSLAVYRIVQESLTNTLKHAGRTATAAVRVHRKNDKLEVDIADDGAGRANPVGGAPMAAMPGGNGLIGMRERAHVFGGRLSVGPQPGGGWHVHAVLPQGDAAASEQGASSVATGDK